MQLHAFFEICIIQLNYVFLKYLSLCVTGGFSKIQLLRYKLPTCQMAHTCDICVTHIVMRLLLLHLCAYLLIRRRGMYTCVHLLYTHVLQYILYLVNHVCIY